MKLASRLFFVPVLVLLTSLVSAQVLQIQVRPELGQPQEQRQPSRYLRALDDLRGARWMLDHRSGNWAQTRDERAAVQKINDAINEIRGAAFDDRRDNGYHPAFDNEENDRPGRLHHAEQLINRAREDIREAENEGQYRGLRDRTLKHLDAALNDVRKAMR